MLPSYGTISGEASPQTDETARWWILDSGYWDAGKLSFQPFDLWVLMLVIRCWSARDVDPAGCGIYGCWLPTLGIFGTFRTRDDANIKAGETATLLVRRVNILVAKSAKCVNSYNCLAACFIMSMIFVDINERIDIN